MKPAISAAMRERVERRIAEGRLDLPVLPQVAGQILAGGIDDSTEVRTLSDLLHHDQTLAGHVLRVANSAAYAGNVRVQSIQQAVVRIGLSQLREIVVGVALQTRVFRVDGYQDVVGDLWTHSAVTGAYAKEIARLLRVNAESAFLCGLLHDIGKPVVLSLLLDVAREADEPLEPDTCVAILGPYHTRVGHTLAERWKLPESVSEAIAQHHDFEAANGNEQAVKITCLANLLSHAVLDTAETAPNIDDTVRSHPVCAALNLYPDDLDTLLERRGDVLRFAEAFGR